jgi:hypothetical protein
MAGKEDKLIKGTITLENGDKSTFYLNSDHVRTLEQDAQNIAKMMNWDKPWDLAMSIASSVITQGIERMKENNKMIKMKGAKDYDEAAAD